MKTPWPLILSILMNLFLFGVIVVGRPQPQTIEKVERDTVLLHEFHTDTVFMERRKTVTRTITKTDTIWKDSTSNYKIEIASPSVDWYKLDYYKKDTVTVYDTRVVTKMKKKRFSYGVSAGFGYGITTRKPDLFVGVSIQYNFN